MKYMLDTNICIYLIKRRPAEVVRRFLAQDPAELCISAVSCAELMHGVEKSQAPQKNRLALSLLLSPLAILPFDGRAAEEYGRIRAALERRGAPIGPMDLLIAAHARAAGLTIVTNNTREFDRVDGLTVENWVST